MSSDGFEPPIFLRPGEAPPAHLQPAAGGWAPAGIPGAPQPPAQERDGMGFPAEDPVRPWPWWVALVALAAAFLAIIGAGVLLAIIGAALGGGEDALNDYDYVFGIVQDVLWVAVAIGIPLAIVHWIRPEHLGLRGRHLGFSALKLIIVLFGFYMVAAIYSAAMGLDENSNELLKDTGFGDSLGKDLAYAFLYPVAAPLAEELLFRGVLFKGLRDGFRARLGRGGAVGLAALISGAIFGSLHLGGGQDKFIPVLVALGVLLALAYEWTGTLYVPIAIHALNNAIATASSSDPTHDWVYGVIAAGPILAVLLAVLLGRFIRRLPSEPPPTLPPSFPTAPTTLPSDGPPSDRPLGV
jgi:membrane protease YdiL (CAAX protease family)